MPWWGWIVIGCFLLVAELLGVDAAFYLIFIGLAAVLTGLIGAAGYSMPEWGQWLAFSAIALTSMVLFRARLYERFRGNAQGFANTLIGEIVDVSEDIPSGQRARISLRGSVWTAVNVGSATIRAGESSKVIETDGTVLKIRSMTEASATGGN